MEPYCCVIKCKCCCKAHDRQQKNAGNNEMNLKHCNAYNVVTSTNGCLENLHTTMYKLKIKGKTGI